MPTVEQIKQAYKVFCSHISEYVEANRPLPMRGTTRLGLDKLNRGLGHLKRAGDKAGKHVRETASNQKRQIATMGVSMGVSTGLAAGCGALGVTGAFGGPQAMVTVPITVAVGLTFFAATKYHGARQLNNARKAILTQYHKDPKGVDHGKLFAAVKGGELTTLAQHFEDLFRAEEAFWRASSGYLENSVGHGGSCFKSAEYLYKLLMFRRAIDRLQVRVDSAPGTGMRNVLLFVDLVPQKLYADAEATLARCGEAAVKAMEYVDLNNTSLPHPQRGLRVRPPDEGLLKWATWAEKADWIRASDAGDRMSLLAALVQPFSEKCPTLKGWRAAFAEVEPARVDTKKGIAKGIAKGMENQLTTKVPLVNMVGKPVTSVVIKEFVTHSFSNGASWGMGFAGAGLTTLAALPLNVALGAVAEVINAKLDEKKIFSNTTSLREKVRAIATVLQYSGISAMETLDKEMPALSNSIRHDAEWVLDVLGPYERDKHKLSQKLKELFERLYSLHEKLAELATLHALWEILVNLIDEEVAKWPEYWNELYLAFESRMRHRLEDARGNSYHTNCETACYRILQDPYPQFENPLPPVRG
jgi:hypothetical protein